MARLITRIVVRSFGGSEPLEVFQAPEPNSLKLSGFLDAYCGYFGKPLAELQMAGDGKNCLVGWVFGVPDVRGQFPVRGFGHQMSAPLAVMFNFR
jgi:hypothetical protein